MIVRHSRGEYEIQNLELGQVASRIQKDDLVAIDSNVAQFYPDLTKSSRTIVVPAGEQSKSFQSFGRCVDQVARHGLTRKERILAIGGGVVGDLIGFVAASYMRGVPFVQVPTTLLSLVDSSVGGKVAIDLPAGKNLVGAFWPPSEVWLCPAFMNTLPPRQIRSGMAEIWKAGYIEDASFVTKLRHTRVKNQIPSLELIERSIQIKADVVMDDEFEQTGRRAKLNFGHTIGHAIEKVLNYRHLSHGEAVGIGMVLEAELGAKLGITPNDFADEVRQDLTREGLPTKLPPRCDQEAMIASMFLDKKSSKGEIAMSLVTSTGACKLVAGVEADLIRSVLSGS